jgi:tRNA nucleotidyltransferase/poly(A) polymerase
LGRNKNNDEFVSEMNLNNDRLLDEFNKLQNKSELSEILKELFDINKLELISELSNDETKLITRIYNVSDTYGLDIWKNTVKDLLKLRLSHKRKSRNEIISAVKGYFSSVFTNKQTNQFKRNNGGMM